jgi:hypothetical protein
MTLPQFFQAHSLFWIAGALVLVMAVLLFRSKPKLPEIAAFAAIVLGMLIVYIYIRPTQTVLLEEAAQVQAMIGQGKPVLLKFQSPY